MSCRKRGPYKKQKLKDDASTVVLKSDSEVVTVITKQARSNEITEVKPSIIKSTCAGPERQNQITAVSNATTTILNSDEKSEDDTITVAGELSEDDTITVAGELSEDDTTIILDEISEDDTTTLLEDNIDVSVLVDQPNIVINNFNIDCEYEQPEIGGENSHIDYILSELQNEIVNIDDQEYADINESSEATVLTDPVVELQPDEVAEIEKSQTLENEKDKGQDPVFPGSSRKLGFMILFICCLSIRFKLPDEALNYIMMLTGMVLPAGHNMIQSIYTLKEYLRKFVSCPKIHYLCSTCGTHVSKNDKTCKNKTCNQNLSTQGAIGYFIQHSVIDQLQVMCQRSSFLKKIRTHRFEHYKANTDEHLTDVYDGYMYKKMFDSGFLRNPNGISFSMNTDGVPVFKSSRISMWPVYMLINELPIGERKLKENIVYYGLWICSKKPVMWSYLKPLHEELSKLEDGVDMKDNKDEIFTMYASLFNCVCDLPAKCMMSNSMQFNGAYGCWYCYQPGTTYKTDKGGHTHIFPYQEGNPKGPERTVESLQSDVNEVIAKIHQNEKNYIVRGVKGPFWFMFLKNFDVIHGFVIDYMHGICGGIMKMLLTFWFDKKFKHQTFSLFNEKNNVNRRLAAIKPNIHITRPPRSLDELCHWKSSEYRNFLFLWGIPVLKGIMPQQYLMHFTLLVRSIYNLSRENISGPELDNAEQCLFKFVELFTSFYPERNLTMNCHQLLHITDSVRANGPLFANNCFIFEDLNGYLLKNIHGTTGVETQVINAITMMQAIPTLQELYVEDSEDSVLINSILRPNYMYQNVCIEEGIYQLGQTFKKILNGEEYCAVSKILPFLDVSVVGYNKVFFVKLSCPVYGSEYGRLLKRNQSIVKFKDFSGVEKYGSVKTFIQNTEVNSCTSHNFALIYPFECISVYSHQQSSHEVTPQYIEISAVPLLKILKVCNIIVSGDITYVSEFPNKHEKD